MILWKTPITDRSQSDVDRVTELLEKGWSNLSANEQTEWINGLKGSLNTSDLERIENNIQLLSDVLEIGLSTYAGNIPEYPNIVYFENLLSNIEIIRNAYCVHSTTPTTPNTVNKYTDINYIEQILEDVYTILQSNFYYYCGQDYYCGGDIGLLI